MLFKQKDTIQVNEGLVSESTKPDFRRKSSFVCIHSTLRIDVCRLRGKKVQNVIVGRLSDTIWIPLAGKPKKYFSKTSGVSAEKDLLQYC